MSKHIPKPTGFLTDSEGKRTSVILSLDDYEELLQDLADLALVAERRDDDTTSHEDVVRELRRDGLL